MACRPSLVETGLYMGLRWEVHGHISGSLQSSGAAYEAGRSILAEQQFTKITSPMLSPNSFNLIIELLLPQYFTAPYIPV